MNVLELRFGIIKIVKVNSRGKETKLQLLAIPPPVPTPGAGKHVSFRIQVAEGGSGLCRGLNRRAGFIRLEKDNVPGR